MRWLMAAVIGMGILIVAGVAVLVVLLVQRMSSVSPTIASVGPAALAATLDEPAGTRIVSASVGADKVAVVLSGAGPDRVVIMDSRSGRVVGRVGLAR